MTSDDAQDPFLHDPQRFERMIRDAEERMMVSERRELATAREAYERLITDYANCTIRDMDLDAFADGVVAYRNGVAFHENPHNDAPLTVRRLSWHMGWNERALQAREMQYGGSAFAEKSIAPVCVSVPSTLIIGEAQRLQIAVLRATAAANPQDPKDALTAAERAGKAYRDMMETLTVELPVGYFVTYSHETQPIGLCHHISVSVARPGKMPSVEAVGMILEEFGMQPLETSASIWTEPVSPTVTAVNIVQKVEA